MRASARTAGYVRVPIGSAFIILLKNSKSASDIVLQWKCLRLLRRG
jgi:hypothetical protein